ncbi:MAG TPA: HupE/UreJ family protein [Pseudomonadales bacterium]|nr:HupE/UreJ family protein [Pseudomonadales bacterium]
MCSYANAHSGLNHTHGFGEGLAHPFSGLDHLAAMAAVGMWAAQQGGKAVWAVPATFVCALAAGAGLSMTGMTLPLVEPGIVASVLVLGLLIAAAIRLPLAMSSSLVALFALQHGYAHGVEMPQMASGLQYGVGFVCASVLLHLSGVGLAGVIARYVHPKAVRLLGGGIAAAGLYLSVV